ncbi:glycosyltransferase, partial [Candidatus Babeliales bacterium]|nr:glycosyltransferase [Candidatus Babeliales bacterium]
CIRAWSRVLKLKLREILKPYKQKLGTILKPLEAPLGIILKRLRGGIELGFSYWRIRRFHNFIDRFGRRINQNVKLILKRFRAGIEKGLSFWMTSRLGNFLVRFRCRIDRHLEWFHLPIRCWFLIKQARRLASIARKRRARLVISFLPYTNAIAILGKIWFHRKLKVIVNVHSVKSRILEEEAPFDRSLIRFLVRKLYGKADLIVAVAEGVKKDLVDNFKLPSDKIQVMNNPIDLERIRALAFEKVNHPWLIKKDLPIVVAVGRLVKVKGFDLLIEAVAMLPKQRGCRLMIIGQGEDRLALEEQVNKLGLTHRVAFLGFRKNPWKYMKHADCLVLSSRSEGFPNVIGEALAINLPIIATDCSLSVREYLQDGRYGILVPSENISELAGQLERILYDNNLKQRFARRAGKRAEHFSLHRIVEPFETTLKQVMLKQ